MKYMGSKSRIARYIVPIMEAERTPNQWWVEPFVGGANSIIHASGLRLGADINHHLISLLLEMTKPDFQVPLVSESEYRLIKAHPEQFPSWIVGYAGFQLSFGAKWMDSYRKDRAGIRNYAIEAKRNIEAQALRMKGINFLNYTYTDLPIPSRSLVYADPPYEGTTKYATYFDHVKFWDWCRQLKSSGHTVFVSEYHAPDDFKCVWQREVTNGLSKSTRKEKLWTI